MSEIREKVYDFIKNNGPVVPMQVAKFIESDSFIASAVLAELLTNKRLKITNAAIGGSRLYYIPGQESQLGPRLYDYLKSREKDAYNLLKTNIVLVDKELEPWCRVALRDLKDFAVPLNITHGSESALFWKYHTVSDAEVADILNKSVKEMPENDETIVEDFQVVDEEPVEEIIEEKIIPEEKTVINQTLLSETKKIEKLAGNFYESVKSFFDLKKIDIIEEKQVKKNKEFDFVVRVPSNIGDMVMYVKAKEKKSYNDNDIILAYAEAQQKNLIGLFLGNGKLSKKAEEVINKKYHGQILFRKL